MVYDLTPLWITFKLASVTTIILLIVGIPIAYWLSFQHCWYKIFVETLVSMPLVLPPTVLGFYLLVAFSPKSWLGGWFESMFDVRIVFSFAGLVIGSVIFSLPFMVNPLKSGFQNIPRSLIDAAYTLGKSNLEILWKVLLPNMRSSLWTAVVMSFAHTLGEFGVVLMIGGNIPGETKVASIAIFEQVEALNYATANFYSLVLVAISFCILFALNIIQKRTADIFY